MWGAWRQRLVSRYPAGQNMMMLLTRREWPILAVNLAYLPVFTALAVRKLNFEFLLYVGVILILGAWIVVKQRSVRFAPHILWGLTLWGIVHMAGGNFQFGGNKLYDLELVRLVPSLHILRYDQVVHTFGFGVATLVCAHLLSPHLRTDTRQSSVLLVLVLLMGAGMGVLNEILEFGAVLIMPETGVGGYENTMLDLCFNLLGGILAVGWLTWTGGFATSSDG